MRDQTTSDFLLASGLLVSTATADAMAAAAVSERLSRGEFLFHQGDPAESLHVLREGQVEVLTTRTDGQELVFRALDPGALMGELTVFDDVARTASVRAVTDSTLIQLSRQSVIGLAQEHPDLGIALARIAARRVRLLSRQLEHTSFDPLADRLRALLATLAQVSPDGTTYINTTQASLGSQLGVTREAVNRNLQLWKTEGHITTDRAKILIADKTFLE